MGVCVLGIGVGAAGGAAGRHPFATLAVCLAVLLTAVGGRHGHRSRRDAAARAGYSAATAAPECPDDAPGAPDALVAPEPVDYRAMAADEFECAVAALCERDGCADVRVDHDWLTAWADGTGPAPWTVRPGIGRDAHPVFRN